MKNLIFVFAIFSCFAVKAQESNPLADIELKKGLHLEYSVSQGSKGYFYIVDFVSVTESEVVFNWSMTEPVNKSGVITLTSKALKDGSSVHFYPSTITYDNNDICMLLGTDLLTKILAIKDKESITFNCDACLKEVTIDKIEKLNYYPKNSDNEEVPVKAVTFQSIHDNGTFTVLENSKFPLILFFSYDMMIMLKSFSYN